MPIFSFGDKTVFFHHIPKTGGTSIEKAIEMSGGKISGWSNQLHEAKREGFPCSPQHWHDFIIKEVFPEFEFKFAVTRHPVSRIISEYKHRARWAIQNERIPLPFGEWINLVFDKYSENPYFYDNHIRPQVQFVDDKVDIFRQEDGLDKPVEFACDILGIKRPDSIPFSNKGADVKVDLTREDLEMIYSFYHEDFALFGYEKRF